MALSCFRNTSRKTKAVITSICIYVFLSDFGIWTTKVRHPGQWLVKKMTRPHIIEKKPDLEEDFTRATTTMPLCPKTPPSLYRQEHVQVKLTGDLDTVEQQFKPFQPGGHFKPPECVSRTNVAIVIPNRNRDHHLEILITNLIPFLVNQQAEFSVFVVQQDDKGTFNKGILLNVGFVEAMKTKNFTCFIFHDVDLLPESHYNLYRCGDTPRHYASATSKFGYQLPYYLNAGGVIGMPRHVYQDVNGHSNLYFGWGGEDDDMLWRLVWKQHTISRSPDGVSRYTSILHNRDSGNDVNSMRYRLLWTSEKRVDVEGLNTMKYKIVKMEKYQLYTWILVNVNISDYRQELEDYT